MANNKNGFIGVKEFEQMVSVIHGKANEFLGMDEATAKGFQSEITSAYSTETYKQAFETLAKHVRGWAEYHDDGSLLMSLVMESNEDLEDKNEDAFVLIEQALTKGGVQ
ncbi:hypothetical protein [Alkalihalobacillus sp. 1P02AB]|uniref:hypothetical protein n=1 Tax=Alkalihalobacillus sp. 1P02AB TaxID=3132260 RepID=UPI0039A457FD